MGWRANKFLQGALLVVLVLGLLATLSSLFGLTAQICADATKQDQSQCPRYNLVLVLGWHFTETANWASPAITAFATIVMAAFTGTLWRATTKQGGITQSALNHTIRTDVTTQRAYLGRRSIESVEFKSSVTDDGTALKAMEVTPTWENNGATPAINVKFCALKPIICPGEIPEGLQPEEIEMGPLPRIAIGARQTMSGGGVRIEIEDCISASKRKCKIFLVFRLEYNDVFSDTPMRITQYCEEMRFAGIEPITRQPLNVGDRWPFVLYGHPRFQVFT
jgi:type III secretory pathway component EscS